MLKTIKIEELYVSPFNVRFLKQTIDDEMSANIRKVGIIEPLTVRKDSNGKYEVITGQRRFIHARHAELKEVPCNVVELNDLDSLFASFSENEFKDEITPQERAIAIAAMGGYDELIPDDLPDLLKVNPTRLTHQALADKLGYKAAQSIESALKTLKLKDSIAAMAREAKLSTDTMKMIVEVAKKDEERIRIIDALNLMDATHTEKLSNKDFISARAIATSTQGGVDGLINAILKRRQEKTEEKLLKTKKTNATKGKKKGKKKTTQRHVGEKTAQGDEKSNESAQDDPEKLDVREIFFKIPLPVFVGLSKYQQESETGATIGRLLVILAIEYLKKNNYLEADYINPFEATA